SGPVHRPAPRLRDCRRHPCRVAVTVGTIPCAFVTARLAISGTAALPPATTERRARDRGDSAMATAPFGTLLRHIQKLAAGRRVQRGSDRRLLAASAARRDEAASAALAARHGPMVLRVCRRVLNHEQDAEDAFQATFLVLARNTGSIRKRDA